MTALRCDQTPTQFLPIGDSSERVFEGCFDYLRGHIGSDHDAAYLDRKHKGGPSRLNLLVVMHCCNYTIERKSIGSREASDVDNRLFDHFSLTFCQEALSFSDSRSREHPQANRFTVQKPTVMGDGF